jgi:Type ISP C-terminal specificity domain
MDVRWCYYTGVRPLWNEPRPDYIEQLWPGNATIMTRRKGVANPEGVPFFFTSCVGFQHALNTDAYYVPLQIRDSRQVGKKQSHGQMGLLHKASGEERIPNLSVVSTRYLDSINAPRDISFWMHCLAIGYSPAYLLENADGIRQDWPHIPLPDSRDGIIASAQIGAKIASLLDIESPVEGVTAGDVRAELRSIAVTTRAGGGNLKESDLALTAGWGHAGKGGVTMPGKGRLVEREYSQVERKALLDGANALGLPGKQLFAHFGDKTCDVDLNDTAYWSNIPSRVWDYTIGGYQVIKKWLSYREEPLLGRPLTKDEVRYVQEMARRIAAILLLEPALDANYESIKQHTFPWNAKGGES